MAIDSQTLETVIRRATTVTGELSLFATDEYPEETTRLRNVLCILSEYITRVLLHIRSVGNYSNEASLQVQQLARNIHELYAMVRYLRASASVSTPPALQVLVNALTSKYLDAKIDSLTIVRPQWEYNCKFVNLSYELSKITLERLSALTGGAPSLLNRTDLKLPNASEQDSDRIGASQIVLQRIGTWLSGESTPVPIPRHIAVLSLAGVDKNDVFLYPMMAHEVAHSLTYSKLPTPTHMTVTGEIAYTRDAVKQALTAANRQAVDSDIPAIVSITTRKIEICIRELLADLVATRMLGLAFVFGLGSFLKGLFQWSDPLIAPDSSYPSMRLRLKLCLEELLSLADIKKLLETVALSDKTPPAIGNFAPISPADRRLAEVITSWKETQLSEPLIEHALSSDVALPVDNSFIQQLCENAIVRNQSRIIEAARTLIPEPGVSWSKDLAIRVEYLSNRLPPLLNSDSLRDLPVILAAGWVHREVTPPESTDDYERRNRLVTKAIELAASAVIMPTDDQEVPNPPTLDGNVFTGDVIAGRSRLAITDFRRLSIIPSPTAAPEAASLDLRLGNWFKLSRRPKLPVIDISKAKDFLRSGVLHDEFFVKTGEGFILHAGDFALGITLEFIGMPSDAMAFVEGKSSIGRTGLIVATATQVAPGFHGCVVLELANTGTVPLRITPGMRIAQLVVIGTSHPVTRGLYRGEYDCQIKP